MIIRIMNEAYCSPVILSHPNQALYFGGMEFWCWGEYETIRDVYVGF